ncbi:AAA domain-containing protein [Halosegnis longus]|uniref:AAA domain-containing protein n=1 Tax=Halosegnis longus TaxID=2216012 RepID=UPI00096ABAA4|nr:AAA domain-containing protein [Salella cibi]
MNIRGPVVACEEPRTVDTSNGTGELAEVEIRPEGGTRDPVTVTLWGKWTETAAVIEAGMDLLVVDPDEREYQGETQYATGRDTFVVVNPDFLVDVTDVRAWVQCPRMYYLNKLSATPLAYPVVRGTVVHEVFGDLLRGHDLDESIEERVAEAGLDIGLLEKERDAVAEEVRQNAGAIEGWLAQGTLTEEDEWRSEQTLLSETFGIKGRADAVRRGMPVELKTGKNLKRDPRFHDKVQAACYALVLGEHEARREGTSIGAAAPDTGTLLYTKNNALDRTEENGDLSPAKEFSLGVGLLKYVVRQRNEIAAMEHDFDVPTGYEADAVCEYCFEQDTCMVVSGRLDQESKAGQIGTPVPDHERDYFDRFYRALEEERREVHAEYRKLWEQTAAERADDDRALVDLDPVDRTERPDGSWELRARRTSEAVSKLREGDIALASDGHPTRGTAELARIQRLDDEVVVTADEPFDLRRLDVYPSELNVARQLAALHDAILKGDPDEKDVLFGQRPPEFSGPERTYIDNNDAQDAAVNKAVRADDFALVHGPPGTGKTYTLARTVRALVADGQRVLLSAFTNRAVDNALEALREQGFESFVRVGTESGVRADMQDKRLATTGDPKEVTGTLADAQVVAATTASCGSRAVREQEFDVAVVDEAGQLTEPGTLAAVNRADRFVLVGDHQQLPPVVRAENDLQTSLFERLIEQAPEAGVLLDRQYRMAQQIQWFSSREFYDGQLRPATPEVAGQTLADIGVDTDDLPPELREQVAFVDPDGEQTGNTNRTEADRVADIVESYVAAGVPRSEIGVIAPFRAQVAELSKRLPDTTVDTVDRFQGSATEVIVISFVATGGFDGPIFEDTRRMNVALTRAKKALALVGDAETLASEPFYDRLLDWARA